MVAGTKLDRVRTANRYLGSEEFRDRILSYEHRAPGIQYRYNLLCFKPVFFFFCTLHHRRCTHKRGRCAMQSRLKVWAAHNGKRAYRVVCVCVASCVRVCAYMCVRVGLCIFLCVCVAKSLPQGFRPYTQRTSVKYTVFRRVYMLAVYYIINIMHIKWGQMLQIFFFKSRRGTLRPREFVMCTPGGVKERRADNRRTNDRAPRLRKTARCIILYRLYIPVLPELHVRVHYYVP